MNAFFRRVLAGDATKAEARDTGSALVLVLLLLALSRHKPGYIWLALVGQLVVMTVPQVFRPAAVLWFGLAQAMSAVASRVVLAVVFYGILTPIALIRRWRGKDTLMLRAFGRGRESVMKQRDYTFVGKDLEQPY